MFGAGASFAEMPSAGGAVRVGSATAAVFGAGTAVKSSTAVPSASISSRARCLTTDLLISSWVSLITLAIMRASTESGDALPVVAMSAAAFDTICPPRSAAGKSAPAAMAPSSRLSVSFKATAKVDAVTAVGSESCLQTRSPPSVLVVGGLTALAIVPFGLLSSLRNALHMSSNAFLASSSVSQISSFVLDLNWHAARNLPSGSLRTPLH